MRVVVIGSGITGASAAYHAARLGADVLLIDRDAEGTATAAGAGIVAPWTSRLADPAWLELAATAAAYYPELVGQLADDGHPDLGYRQVGALRLAAPAEIDEVHQQILARKDATAGAIDRITGKEARELFPPLREDFAAVHISGGARVDGRRVRTALRAAAAAHGAVLRSGRASLRAEAGRVTGVDVDGDRVAADTVVVAAGAWSARLLAPIGVRVNVAPQRGQIVHLRLAGARTGTWPVVIPPSSHYLLAFDDERVVAGATREDGTGFDYRVTAIGLAEVLGEALAVAPGLAQASVLETRIGFRPAGPDRFPLLGAVPGVDGLVVATGLGPSGLTLGPHVGRLAAALALDSAPGSLPGSLPETDRTSYDPLRG